MKCVNFIKVKLNKLETSKTVWLTVDPIRGNQVYSKFHKMEHESQVWICK